MRYAAFIDYCLALALPLALAGCDAAEGSGEDGTDAGDEGTADGSGGEPTVCSSIGDRTACGAESGCFWYGAAYEGSTDGTTCSFESTGRCLSTDVQNGPQGCAIGMACGGNLSGNVYYEITEDGPTLLMSFCGGTPPANLQACSLDLDAPTDPPECACACDLFATEG